MIGQTLSQYRITEKLGAGGMGEVYKALDTKLDRDVAIKMLPEAVAGNPERLARFEREAKLLASLNHSNIATVHGLHEADGIHFIAMELVEGKTLTEWLSEDSRSRHEVLRVLIPAGQGLAAAHRAGLVHRDFKPTNVIIGDDGRVRVIDFCRRHVITRAPRP